MATEELQIKIGQTIKKLLIDNEWTQEDVAKQLYICRDAYGDIERGKTDICLSRLSQIANLYSVDVTFLFGFMPCTTNYNQYNNSKSRIKNHHNHCHISSEEKSQHELEKQQIQLELKDKELAMQQRENENLKVQIAQLQKINALLEKNQ